MINKKGMGVGAWILIILIILVIGVIFYVLLSEDAGTVASGGNALAGSIPQPPALPTG